MRGPIRNLGRCSPSHYPSDWNPSLSSTISSEKYQDIRALTRQLFRWFIASQQDNNPIIGMLHINYAVGYLGALREIANEHQIQLATNLDINQIEREITGQQDKILLDVAQQCPQVMMQTPIYQQYLQQFLTGNSENVS